MKPIVEQANVERIGLSPEDESDFTIENSAEMFEILSSGIYTDGIAAPIRELSCNAYDAHMEAGKGDVPFEIHLPNQMEPWFSVKDFGPGLSEEELRYLYPRYGKSTKQGTNEQIGEKGLGSKSPLAYTEAFTVISRYDGILQNYEVYLNEDNKPKITKFGDPVATDECNGLEVKMTVRSEDFNRFAEKTGQLLKYFPVVPVVKGRGHFKFDERPNDAYEGDGYFTSRGYRYDNDKFTAVMGYVPYKVDSDQIEGHLTNAEEEFLAQHKIVVFFDIGELATAASREEIKYKKKSIASLVEAVQKARVDYLKRVDDDMIALTKDIDGRWEAYRTLDEKFENVRQLTSISDDYEWTADIVNEWIESEGKIDFMTPDYHTMVCYVHGRTRAVRKKDFTSNSVPHLATIKPDMHHDIVVVMDVRVRSSLRLNQYLTKLGRGVNVITLTPTREKVIKERQPNLTTVDYDKDFDDLIAGLGHPEVVKLSEVTTDVKATYSGKRTVGLTFNQFQGEWYPNNSSSRRPGWNIVDAPDAGDEVLYVQVETTSKKIVDRAGETLDWSHYEARRDFADMISVINAVKGTQYSKNELYGVTKKVVKSIKGNDDWTNIFDLFEESANELSHLQEYFANKHHTSNDYYIKRMAFDSRFLDMCDTHLEDDSPLRTILEPHHLEHTKMMDELENINEEHISDVRNLGRRLGLDGFVNPPTPKPLFDPQDVIAEYPLLRRLNTNPMDHEEIFTDYIALVDAAKKS